MTTGKFWNLPSWKCEQLCLFKMVRANPTPKINSFLALSAALRNLFDKFSVTFCQTIAKQLSSFKKVPVQWALQPQSGSQTRSRAEPSRVTQTHLLIESRLASCFFLAFLPCSCPAGCLEHYLSATVPLLTRVRWDNVRCTLINYPNSLNWSKKNNDCQWLCFRRNSSQLCLNLSRLRFHTQWV